MVLVVKNLPANAGDLRDAGLIPGSGRCPGGGHGSPLQYSCLENPLDRGPWWAMVHRATKNQVRLKQLSMHACPEKQTHTGFPGGPVVENLPCDVRDTSSTPGLRRFPCRRKWQLTPVVLPGESPRTEEPGRLKFMGSQRVGHD